MIYGYCRISKNTQSIERQIRNIIAEFNNARIIEEAYTGTKIQGREKWNKLFKTVKEGDTIVFDSVSRMSRNEDEGVEQYMQLFERGVNLIFLKERHIDTDRYKKQIETIQLPETDNVVVNAVLEGVRKALLELAKEQIRLAFRQAEKEVKDLQQRTKEGLITAKRNKKRIGLEKGTKLVTKKSIQAKEIIRKHGKNFGGALSNAEVIKLAGINRSSFYKYQKELIEELNNQD